MLRQFGVLYQGGALWSSMTLAENVSLPLREFTDISESKLSHIFRCLLSIFIAHHKQWRPGNLIFFGNLLFIGAAIFFSEVKLGNRSRPAPFPYPVSHRERLPFHTMLLLLCCSEKPAQCYYICRHHTRQAIAGSLAAKDELMPDIFWTSPTFLYFLLVEREIISTFVPSNIAMSR